MSGFPSDHRDKLHACRAGADDTDRLPDKPTFSFGQRLVYNEVPAKVSIPGMSGSSGTDRMPDAATTNRATNDPPPSVSTTHSAANASKVIATTLVSKVVSKRAPG
ncbi:hypothetical protein ACVWWN_006195 [Mycobacterium sp. URHB0021]|jgi:hypothetical protein